MEIHFNTLILLHQCHREIVMFRYETQIVAEHIMIRFDIFKKWCRFVACDWTKPGMERISVKVYFDLKLKWYTTIGTIYVITDCIQTTPWR